MKLYGMAKRAPNPRRVRIFLAEKGVDLPETPVDIARREHKAPQFLAKNPLGQIPVLELDDGTTISESLAICRYFEEIHPEPPLFGRGPLDKARVEMWTRRVELVLLAPLRQYFLHAHPYSAGLVNQFRDFGQSNLKAYEDAQLWFDRELADRPFLAGDAYSVADICALCTVDFGALIDARLSPAAANLAAWRERASARPSARA